MDPLSIATGLLAVVGVAVTTANKARRFCRGARSLNEDLERLVTELSSLQGSLNDVNTCLESPEISIGVAELERQSGYAVTSTIVQTMRNCDLSMRQMHACFSEAFPSQPGSGATWFERGVKSNKLDGLQIEITRVRQQIQSHMTAMQLSLSTLNLSHQRLNVKVNQENALANRTNADANRANTDALREVLSTLKTMKTEIGQMGKNQDRLEATKRLSGKDAADDVRMIDDFETLRRSSIAICEMSERTLSVTQIAAVSTAASAFTNVRRKALPSAGASKQGGLLPRLAEDGEEVGMPDPPLRPRSAMQNRFESEKRHMSFDDAAGKNAAIADGSRPNLPHTSQSFPLQSSTGETESDEPSMSVEQFEEAMEKAIKFAEEKRKGHKDSFNDADIDHISSLLVAIGKLHWSERPRTYLVLRLIGEVRAIEGFIMEGYKDIQFPYATEDDLPTSLRSPKARRDFISKQSLVLTPRTAALVSGGRHIHIENADTKFKNMQSLGHGGQGTVDKVTSKLDLHVYARKRIRKPRELAKNLAAMQHFENEIHSLKRLQHKHLVNFVGSYTDRKYVGIIMEPVADTDLKNFLRRSPFPESGLNVLRSYFGCLCAAVRYLHDNKFRHKDLKPANILVKDNQVYITDFGLALDWSELPGDTTCGAPTMYTHAYAAPEVALGAPRNTQSDIWSLGCVFLDMLTVLNGRTLDEKKLYMGTRGSVMDVSQNSGGLFGWLNEIDTTTSQDEAPLRWVEAMLKREGQDRPTASGLMDQILSYRGRHAYCGECCHNLSDLSDGDSFRASETDEEPDVTSQSYTRSTVATMTTGSSATGKSNNSVSGPMLSPQRLGVDEWAFGDDPSQDLSEEPTVAPADFLYDILPLSSGEAESRLLKERSENKAEWEARFMMEDVRKLTDKKGNSLLHIVADFEDATLVRDMSKLLLRNEADLGARNLGHNTPLHRAASTSHPKLVRDLLGKGADVSEANLRKQTPLHVASRAGNAAITKRLLHSCAPDAVDMRDDDGKTALHWACSSGSAETIAVLLEKGADPHAVDERGNTAFILYNASIGVKESTLDGQSLDNPAFEDFVEEAANVTLSAVDPVPVETDDDFQLCGCQVCKTKKALQTSEDEDDAFLEDRDLCLEVVMDMATFDKELTECECLQCKKIRDDRNKPVDVNDEEPLGPGKVEDLAAASDKGASTDDLSKKPAESPYPECLPTPADSSPAAHLSPETKTEPDCTGPECLADEKPRSQDTNKAANDDTASTDSGGAAKQDTSGAEEESKEGDNAPSGCKCPACVETRARAGRPSECPCPACEYQGHAYWDARIDRMLKCRCDDCRSKDKVAADDILVSAGFTGKKSYVLDLEKAWNWTMDHALTLKNVEIIVKLLLDHGADVETEDWKGRRFLHIAALSNDINLARTLLDHGAFINAARSAVAFAQKRNFTALDYAVYNKKDEIIRFLLREGFDLKNDVIVNQIVEGTDFPETSLSTLPMLLAHGPKLEMDYKGMTPLQLAVSKGNKRVARLLLKAGADVDGYTEDSPRPLFKAISSKDHDMVELLLDFEPDVHEYKRAGEIRPCALLAAAMVGDGELVTMLLDRTDAKVDVDRLTQSDGRTALHYLAKAPAMEVMDAVEALIEHGASITPKSHLGHHPIHIAAYHGSAFLVAFLLGEGADQDVKNNEGKTPLDFAVEQRHKEVVEILGGKLPPPKKKRWYHRS